VGGRSDVIRLQRAPRVSGGPVEDELRARLEPRYVERVRRGAAGAVAVNWRSLAAKARPLRAAARGGRAVDRPPRNAAYAAGLRCDGARWAAPDVPRAADRGTRVGCGGLRRFVGTSRSERSRRPCWPGDDAAAEGFAEWASSWDRDRGVPNRAYAAALALLVLERWAGRPARRRVAAQRDDFPADVPMRLPFISAPDQLRMRGGRRQSSNRSRPGRLSRSRPVADTRSCSTG